MTHSRVKSHLNRKTQLAVSIFSVMVAVVLPQVFHAVGLLFGLGAAPGAAFLPMHIPVLLAALVGGPAVGIVVGLLSPLVSFAIAGMPSAILLPFLTVELATYGFMAGLLTNSKMPMIGKLLITQVVGRVARIVAVFLAFYVFGSPAVSFVSALGDLAAGLPGVVLQWVVIPPLAKWMCEKASHV